MNEFRQCVLCKLLLERVLALVKALVQHNSRLLDALEFREIGIRGRAEHKVIPELFRHTGESGIALFVVCRKVSNQDNFVRRLELFQRRLRLQERYRGHGLLGHVRNDRLSFSRTGVRGAVLESPEDFDSRVALDVEFRAEVLVLGAVDFGKCNVLVLQRCGCFLILGGERFAVAAPWCENCGVVSNFGFFCQTRACFVDLHSARTSECSFTKGSKESLVRSWTSLAAASAARPKRPAEYLILYVSVWLTVF